MPTNLYYEVAGQGFPLLLIHGASLDCRMWDDHFAELAKDFRVVRFDLRGFGRTPAATEAFSNYEDIAGLLDELQIEQAIVVGHSFGGYTAIEFALAHPERVAGLVLAASGMIGITQSDDLQRYNARYQECETLEDAVALTVEQWVDGPGRAPGSGDDKVREKIRELTHYAYSLPRGTMPTFLTPAPIDRLHELAMPIRTLVGEFDFVDFDRIADRLVAEAKQAEKRVFEGTAHSLCLERRNDFIAEISSMLVK